MTTRYTANDVLKQLLKIEGVSQSEVSTNLFNSRSRLAVAFSNDSDMTISNFSAACDYLGYDVVVVRRSDAPEKFVLTTEPKRRSNFHGDKNNSEKVVDN